MKAQILLCGVLITADWIASNASYFPLIDEEDNGLKKRADLAWEKLSLPSGRMPGTLVMDNDAFRERFGFYPNDEKRPFYQVPDVKNFPINKEKKKRGYYPAAKLKWELPESESKKRFFTTISGEEKSALSYSEAARWLLYINAFDDMAIKRTENVKKTEIPR